MVTISCYLREVKPVSRLVSRVTLERNQISPSGCWGQNKRTLDQCESGSRRPEDETSSGTIFLTVILSISCEVKSTWKKTELVPYSSDVATINWPMLT